MSAETFAINSEQLQLGIKYWQQGEYNQAALIYEEAIANNPTEESLYWYLGLALLLLGKESEAQLTWMMPMLEADPEQQEKWTKELLQVLAIEAEKQAEKLAYKEAWIIRKHIREMVPENLENLLHIILLEIKLEIFISDISIFRELIEVVNNEKDLAKNRNLLLKVLSEVLDFVDYFADGVELAKICAAALEHPEDLIKLLLDKANDYKQISQAKLAVELGNICLEIAPDHPQILGNMVIFLQDAGRILDSIPLAERRFQQCQNLAEKIAITHLLLQGTMQAGGEWKKANEMHKKYQDLLLELATSDEEINLEYLLSIISVGGYAFYFEDSPKKHRKIRDSVAELFQRNLEKIFNKKVKNLVKNTNSISRKKNKSRVLKIGYLSESLRLHSVGWLVRWVFQYHDTKKFEIHAYSGWNTGDFLQQKFKYEYCKNFHELPFNAIESVDKIYQDDIDILVDLDSLTSHYNCAVMGLKPASIQVSWLGFDASGMPAIDYYIADPYVLPNDAEEYYRETIWRLPQTYLAVDGFEVGVPTIRRDKLDIPNDAIIYFSSQTGYKRHPENVRLQMRILKEVPNSYFLIKGLSTKLESVENFFREIAESEGVADDRLRFLPPVETSQIHRANLSIADVVLDTYPYNGATTTLETLWMGVPLVTRVGEQFASRNSYTMLMNVGVTEGIAWTNEEYVEWGIRLGKDAKLREQISWKLRQSRQTAPLWNAKQFTRELEKAYEQMWIKYIENNY